MKRTFFVILALFSMLLLDIQISEASILINEYNITFWITSDMSVKENVIFTFKEPIDKNVINYLAVGDITSLKVSNGEKFLDYTLTKIGSETKIGIYVPEGTQKLEMNFTVENLVFTKDSVYAFFVTLKTPLPENMNIFVYLPAGYYLYRHAVYPENYKILTDGEKIYVHWSLSKPENVAINLKFYRTFQDYTFFVAFVTSLAFIVVILYLVLYYREKTKRAFERSFSEDERKVLQVLLKEKIIMQNKLEKQLGFSRAKMTRVVKKLEAKGLIEKERVGRTNRLFYKKV